MTGKVCALTALLGLIGGCSRSVVRPTSTDVDVMRAVIQAEACGDAEPSVVLSEPSLSSAPVDSGPLMKFGMDLASRPPGETLWPELELCAGVKVADSSSVRLTYQVSLPVYSPSRKRAVVIVEFHCGPLCGHGDYVELHEIEGVWKITKVEQGWIS